MHTPFTRFNPALIGALSQSRHIPAGPTKALAIAAATAINAAAPSLNCAAAMARAITELMAEQGKVDHIGLTTKGFTPAEIAAYRPAAEIIDGLAKAAREA